MELKGHEVMSIGALDQAVRDLPPNLQWVRKLLDDTVHHAMNRDVIDVWSGGHWSDGGQKHHFMRYANQRDDEAYQVATAWIRENGYAAAQGLRKVWGRTSLRDFNTGFITGPLGYAFHALQDSYSEAHVTRVKEGSEFIITEIQVYDETNKTPHGGWAGHESLDKRWEGELGKEATKACKELTKIVLYSSLVKEDMGFFQRWTGCWDFFADLFLRARFEPAVPLPL
jgi:hypothetical protein